VDGHLYRWPLRFALRRADALGALTPGHAARLLAADGLTAAPTSVPNGTDVTAPLRPPRVGPVRVGCVGRLEPVKGVDLLLRAMARVPGRAWSLHVYGDGSERFALERLANELSLDVTWHGWTSDVATAMGSLDMLVIPSRSEALPMAALEAMACGVTVAAAPVGALPELLSDVGVVLPQQPAQWSEELHRLIEDRAEQERLAAAGQRFVRERFGVASMLDAYESLLSSVVGAGNAVGT
jgi:glycosyltransferase involved in cell wall biosynthesis